MTAGWGDVSPVVAPRVLVWFGAKNGVGSASQLSATRAACQIGAFFTAVSSRNPCRRRGEPSGPQTYARYSLN